MFKYPEEKRPLIGNPQRALIGLFLFLVGGFVVLVNLTMTVEAGGDDILNPFIWGAVSFYGVVVMVWGALDGRGK